MTPCVYWDTSGLHSTFLGDPPIGGILFQKLIDSMECKFSFDLKPWARNEISRVHYRVHHITLRHEVENYRKLYEIYVLYENYRKAHKKILT